MYRTLQKHKHKSRHGARCAFVPMSRYEGVKLYRYKVDRDFAFRMQQKAAKVNIAPKAIRKVDLSRLIYIKSGWGKLEFKYGYVTQRVKVCSYYEDVLSNKQYNWLYNKMRQHGFRTDDLHQNNVGLLNGKPVCIDFDRGTMGY